MTVFQGKFIEPHIRSNDKEGDEPGHIIHRDAEDRYGAQERIKEQ